MWILKVGASQSRQSSTSTVTNWTMRSQSFYKSRVKFRNWRVFILPISGSLMPWDWIGRLLVIKLSSEFVYQLISLSEKKTDVIEHQMYAAKSDLDAILGEHEKLDVELRQLEQKYEYAWYPLPPYLVYLALKAYPGSPRTRWAWPGLCCCKTIVSILIESC